MPADAYYNNVSLLLPMHGSNNGTTFTDYSTAANTVTANGNTSTSTTQSKYYGSSGHFDGTTDYLSIPTSTRLDLTTEDFTIEGWIYANSVASTCNIVSKRSGVLWGPFSVVLASSKINCRASFNNSSWGVDISANSNLPTSQWVHWAFVRSGTSFKLYIDGTAQTATATQSGALYANAIDVYIGANSDGTSALDGYMQDVRVTKGQARYTSTFTPPAKLIGALSGTVKDDTNANAVRTVVAFPRSNPTYSAVKTTSAADGTFTLYTPHGTDAHTVICLDDAAGTTYNDLIYGGVTPV